MKNIETLSDELLGAYSKAENTALSAAFGGRKKKRLNRVFDAVGFVYPDYHYPVLGRKRKNTSPATETTTSATNEPAPQRKKMKVLTHRARFIEPATVPEFGGETSSAATPKESIPSIQKAEEPATLPKAPSATLAEPKTDKAEEPGIEGTKTLEVLSP